MTELKPRIHDESNGLDYVLVGDYYVPDLKLPEEHRPIGMWGRLHRAYLEQYRPARFSALCLSGKLHTYLADLNEQATERCSLCRLLQFALGGLTWYIFALLYLVGQIGFIVLPGDRGAVVPKHLRQFLGIHAVLQSKDGAGMAEIRESDMVDSCFLYDLIVHPAHHLRRVGLQRGRMHKHERAAGVLVVFPDQEVDYLWCQCYRPCLATVLHQLTPYHGTVFRNGQRPTFDIKVAPFQGDELALANACRQRQHEHGEVAQPLGGVQIVLHFQRRQHIGIDLLWLGVVERSGGIIANQAVPYGLIQALLKQAVDVPHGFFSQARAAGSMIAEALPFLQKFSNHLRCQFREEHISQAGENMVLEYIVVCRIGGRSALVPVVGFLPVGDVLSERHIPTSMH